MKTVSASEKGLGLMFAEAANSYHEGSGFYDGAKIERGIANKAVR